ncbi:MAG: alpha/beta family hydrolase [Solirubrobacteraceae bacterium]|nr:alpha/beta hydrolase [Patulibacter sp.]
MDVYEIDTPHGPARAHHLAAAGDHRATLVLGHGAGGSIGAPDLQAVAAAAAQAGTDVLLVEQPYRVAGRKAAAPAKQLDTAWLAVLEALGLGVFAGEAAAAAAFRRHAGVARLSSGAPLFVGGRSSGARVACRTAAAAEATGVLCLAFPLITPKGVRRQDELDGAGVPVLVVQGETDRFGMPEPDPARHREVVRVTGDHGLKRDPDVIAGAAVDWLRTLLPAS